MNPLEIGKLLRASTTGFVVGCRLNQINTPALGALVSVFLDDGTQVYGIITDIHIDDDGLVRQLVTSSQITQEIIADNRENRNVPVEISVLAVGYQAKGKISHLLPPRPPLTLETIYPCGPADIVQFTGSGRFGYFRHILRNQDIPIPEVLAAHIQQAHGAHVSSGNAAWLESATQELITLLRDDYQVLMSVLGALSDMQVGREAA
jgi:hypothetical protein